MRNHLSLFGLGIAVLVSACGTSNTAASDDTASDDASADTSVDIGSDATTAVAPTWRDSLKVCWTDLNCKRALVISHGGDWSIDDFPYDSQSAFHRAADKGADGIKTDVHVTKDNVAIVAHSSPILSYESPDCAGMKIEEMTADAVTKCKLFPSDTETYQRLDTVLEWARGKVIIMLTVKESVDFPRAIETVIEHNALDYVFLETGLGDLQTAVPKNPDWQKSWYNMQTDSEADVDTVIALNNPHLAFIEIDVNYQEAQNAKMADLLKNKIHPAGKRGFVSTIHLPSAEQHKSMWDAGFDIIMTYNLDNAIAARTEVNTARGVSPP
jgi:glycerophosphoryl diester phosphodiesterase